MNKNAVMLRILEEVQKNHKIPETNGDLESENIIKELLENGCIYKGVIRYIGVIKANYYDKFSPSEEEGYIVSRDTVLKIYGIKLPPR